MNIHSLPTEILISIFASLSRLELTRASHINRHWRAVATSAESWSSLDIRERDAAHVEVIGWHLDRAKDRPLSLRVSLHVDSHVVLGLLVALFRPALPRCVELAIHATPVGWDAVAAVVGGQTFLRLQTLDVAVIQPSGDVVPHDTDLGTIQLPNLHTLHVRGQFRLVDPNGNICKWLLDAQTRLELCDITIPPMFLQTEDNANSSRAVELRLARIYASTNSDGVQHDCAPFFDALQTQATRVRVLKLEAFHGRVLEDFLFALGTPGYAYPSLTVLHLTVFALTFEAVRVFLRCFAKLEELVLLGCPSQTVDSVLQVLKTHDVCPKLGGIVVDEALVSRV
ncbi:hypothetical protein C8F01DRAFT_77411 [Mycena amicta]|nr:hypothetical protein C8F01DRAFT_77411 [Mycena amicta]